MSYPHPVLDRIEGEPTAMAVLQLRTQAYANAKSVETHLSDTGWLRILQTEEEYAKHSQTPFNLPSRPGACPTFKAPAKNKLATQPLSAKATRRQGDADKRAMDDARFEYECAKSAHDAARAVWAVYTRVLADLRHQILAAVDPMYFGGVPEDAAVTGLGEVHPQILLGHLVETYGELTDQEIEEHWRSLETVADPSLPIAAMFAKITNVRKLLADVDPVSDKKAITKTLTSLAATGVYRTLITSWDDRSSKKRTWKDFKAHCIKHDKRRKEETTTGETYATAGMGLGAIVPKSTPTIQPRPVQPAATPSPAPRHPPKGDNGNEKRTEYCWSHGLVSSPTTAPHNSATCRRRNNGHCETATLHNRMGGSTRIAVLCQSPQYKRAKHDTTKE
jgi:hypothetical protein